MSFSKLFTDVLDELKTIQDDNPLPKLQAANNFQKTLSNRNQKFKMINIWNDQIDTEILSTKKGDGYSIKCPSVFIELVTNDGNQLLGGVTQYPEACMYFHIYSDQLNTPNNINISNDLIDANLEIFDLRDAITSKMLGFHTHNSSAFMSRYDNE